MPPPPLPPQATDSAQLREVLESLEWPESLSEQRAAALCAACATVRARSPTQRTQRRPDTRHDPHSYSAAQEWQAEQDSGWLRAVHEAHPQQVLSAGESLEKVSSSLGAEEARWRAGTAALQQHWQDEARAMMTRWQAEDTGRLRQAMEKASSESATFERMLGALPPAVRPGWSQLREATRLEVVGPARVAALAHRELSGGNIERSGCGGGGGRSNNDDCGNGGRADEPTASGSPDIFGADASRVHQLLRALHDAGGAAALCDERLGAAMFEALHKSTHAVARIFSGNGDGLDAPRGGREGAALVPAAAVVCALLALVGDTTPKQRLDALLPWILAQSNVAPSAATCSSFSSSTTTASSCASSAGVGGPGGGGDATGGGAGGGGSAGMSVGRDGGAGGGVPLTLAQQRALFATFYVAAVAADAAARRISRVALDMSAAPSVPQQPPPPLPQQQQQQRADASTPHAQPVGGALRRAMERRPQTWALVPPTAREFLVWCAACEPIIGAALAEGAGGS